MQQFGGDCKLRTPLRGRKGARAWPAPWGGGGGGGETGPSAEPLRVPPAAPGGSCLSDPPPLPGPTDPTPLGSAAAPAMSLPRGWHGCADRDIPPPSGMAPREKLRDFWPGRGGGERDAHPSAHPLSRPDPPGCALLRAACRGLGLCAGFPLRARSDPPGIDRSGRRIPLPSPAPPAPRGEIPRRGVHLANFGGGSWQPGRAPAPARRLAPSPNNARFDAR